MITSAAWQPEFVSWALFEIKPNKTTTVIKPRCLEYSSINKHVTLQTPPNKLELRLPKETPWQKYPKNTETKLMGLDHLAGAGQNLKQDAEEVHMCKNLSSGAMSIGYPSHKTKKQHKLKIEQMPNEKYDEDELCHWNKNISCDLSINECQPNIKPNGPKWKFAPTLFVLWIENGLMQTAGLRLHFGCEPRFRATFAFPLRFGHSLHLPWQKVQGPTNIGCWNFVLHIAVSSSSSPKCIAQITMGHHQRNIPGQYNRLPVKFERNFETKTPGPQQLQQVIVDQRQSLELTSPHWLCLIVSSDDHFRWPRLPLWWDHELLVRCCLSRDVWVWINWMPKYAMVCVKELY